MSKSIYTTTLRLNLDKPEDREACGNTCNGWTERSTAP